MAFGTSPAAEFQALQTRAKIASTLWSRAVLTVIVGWIALTIWVVWHHVGIERPELQHAYFGRWILCSLLTDTPFINRLAASLPMYADGAWYALPDFARWLDNIYGASFYTWFWNATTGHGNYGLGSALLPIGAVALLSAWWWRRDPDGSNHLRGLRLISPRQLNREMHGGLLKRAYYGRPQGIQLGKTIIPEHMLFEHQLVTGNSGSGKSSLIRAELKQIEARGQTAVIVDREGEFCQEFYRPERGDVILNPLDQRCPSWSPWSELRNGNYFSVDAEAMAASLIRGRPRDDAQRFFQESTRTVIEAILHVARDDARPKKLWELVSLPRDELQEALKGTAAYALIDPRAHEQGAGILGTAANAIKRFAHLPDTDEALRSWSAQEWSRHRRGWIFLPSREDIHESIAPLQGMWLDLIVRWLMSGDIDLGSDQIWLIADELASLGHQPQIEKTLTRGRKRGIAVVLAFQNVSQLQAIYGREGCITLTSSPSTKVVLRVDETETAKWASELIGEHEIERTQITQLAGLSTYREGLNLSTQRSVEPLVLPDQIKLLPAFSGYLCVAGHHRTTIRVSRMHLVKRQPPFILRQPHQPITTEAKDPADEVVIAQIKQRVVRPAPAAEIVDGQHQ